MSLYEIDYIKEYVDDNFDTYSTGLRTYQIASESELDACAALGQIYFSEEYKIHIVQITKVK